MSKSVVNKYLKKLGIEIHTTGYVQSLNGAIQSLKKKSLPDDPFQIQKDLIGKKEPIIFDVGANRGDVTKKYIQHFPQGTYYCFEPFPATFEILKGQFDSQANVHCLNVAVSDKIEKKQFFVNKNVDTNSLLKPQKAGMPSDAKVKNEYSIDVNTTTIDSFCEEQKIDYIDILKMDIQGGELGALKGAIKMLSRKRISCIYSEVYFVEQYENHPLFHDISKYLFETGYALQDIYFPIYANGNLVWADAIFLLKK
ncbi:MAG: FkbM family methyltransferase [Cyclobacteriaceae bacterium]